MTTTNQKGDKMPEPNHSKDIMERKIEHLKIPIEYDVKHSENYFDDIKLIHHPVPEIDFEDVDLSIDFFKKNPDDFKKLIEGNYDV